MKIALVSPYDWGTPGGVNQHLDHLAAHLIERGHVVRILAPASDAVADPRVIVVGYPHAVPASGSMVRIALDPRLGRQVRGVLAAEQFDVVHMHEPLMPTLPIQVLRHSRAVNPDVVHVGTFHARKDGGNRLYAYGRRLLKRWFQEIDGKIAVSQPAAQYVGRYFPGFYNIIPNGIDIVRFADPGIKRLPNYDDGMLNILYVGRAEKRKGLTYLIRAFGIVNARIANTRLIIVSPESRALRRYEQSVQESGRRNIVFVCGVSDTDLPRYHRTADLLCAPATGHESQGYVLLEAMAASLPMVASNIDGYASVVTHGVEGLLVRPKDPLVLANAITTLLRDADQRVHMGTAGRERAEEYAWPLVAQQVLSYYERLLDNRRGRDRPIPPLSDVSPFVAAPSAALQSGPMLRGY